jgi:hypothetical protein
MSYQIGQKVFAVHFKYRSATLHRYFYTQPFLFCDEVPLVIKFLELKVVSTHAVYAEGDDRTKPPMHRGYLLRDKKGHLFACQYPHAAKDMETQEGCQRINFHGSGDALGNWLLTNPYDFHLLDGALKKLRLLIEATNVDNINPGDPHPRNESRRSKMIRFYNRVIKEFREEFVSEPVDKFELIHTT